MFYIDIVLSDDQRAELVYKDVNFSELTLGTEAFRRCGIAFPESDCEAVLDVLGLVRNEDGRDERLKTPQGKRVDGYVEISLLQMPSPAEPLIWVNNWDCGEYDEEAYSGFQSELGLGIAIKYYDFDVAEYRHCPRVLFVNALSSPTMEFSIDENSFNNRGSRLLVPQNLGPEYIPITHSDGRPMAYFRGDSEGGSLWILFRSSYHERELLDYVLHAAMRLMRPELGAVCSYEEYGSIAARERYIRLASRRLEEEAQEADSRVSNAGEQIEEAQRALVLTLREAEAVKHRREELHSTDKGEMLRKMKERLAKEFDELSASPDFESLEFQREQVIAVTRPLKLRYEGRIYEMGKYEIRIIHEGYIRIENLDSNGHPHLSGSAPCFGNATESIGRLQAEMSFGILLPFLVNYLENGYNPADSYSRIENFKVKNYPESKEVKKGSSKPRAKSAKRKGKSKAAKAGSSKPRRKSAKSKKEVKNGSGKPSRKRAKRSSGGSG